MTVKEEAIAQQRLDGSGVMKHNNEINSTQAANKQVLWRTNGWSDSGITWHRCNVYRHATTGKESGRSAQG